MSYLIVIADRAGVLAEKRAETLAEACAMGRQALADYPGRYVGLSNLDRCDVDDSGLTDEERDAWRGIAS